MKTALQELRDHLVDAWSSPGDLWRPDLIIEKVEQMISIENEQKESEAGKEGNEVEKAAERSAHEKAIDPHGRVTAAAKILHALHLVVGEDVNEFAMPTICQIIENNVWTAESERIKTLEAELTRANARIEELTTQNLELSRKYDDLHKFAYGMALRATRPKDDYSNEEI